MSEDRKSIFERLKKIGRKEYKRPAAHITTSGPSPRLAEANKRSFEYSLDVIETRLNSSLKEASQMKKPISEREENSLFENLKFLENRFELCDLSMEAWVRNAHIADFHKSRSEAATQRNKLFEKFQTYLVLVKMLVEDEDKPSKPAKINAARELARLSASKVTGELTPEQVVKLAGSFGSKMRIPSSSATGSLIGATIPSGTITASSITAGSISTSSFSPSSSGGWESEPEEIDFDNIPLPKLIELADKRLSENKILEIIEKRLTLSDTPSKLFLLGLLTHTVTGLKREPSAIMPAYVADLVELTLETASEASVQTLLARINRKVEQINTVVEGEEEPVEESGEDKGGSPLEPDFGSW